jgi:hypothetical protein
MLMWFKYNDSTFFLYRTDKDSPIYINKFSREGEQRDFWKIGTVIEGQDKIIVARDKAESNGPNPNSTAVSYIHVPPNIIIYHEMDEHGNTFKKKEYHADQDLRIVDFVAVDKLVFIISPDRMFKYSVNKDKLRKEMEIAEGVTDNEFKQIGLTQGRVFLYVKRVDNGEVLYASSKFTEKEDEFGYLHLKGRRVYLKNAGDQNYVVFVVDKKGVGQYWFIKNTQVKKAISLEFGEIKGINRRFQHVVGMKDRIHFYEGLEHLMYIKGSKKGIVKFSTHQPILGIVYDSVHQFLEQDKILLVTDDRHGEHGQLSVVPMVLRHPYVTCVNEQRAIAKYLKFVITTKKIKYQFSVKINGLGGLKYVEPTWYQICWCAAIAFALVLISYCCMKKAAIDRETGKVGFELGRVERVNDEDDMDDTKLDQTQMQDSSDEEDSDEDMNISL